MQLELHRIRTDGNTQARVELQHEVVQEYTAAMEEGATFPPLVVFFDGEHYWLADGFHRYFGAEHAGLSALAVDVREGSQRDAILFSLGANASHGLRRSDADKRKAIMRMLEDQEWGSWSDREIARRCAVHPTTVARVKADIAAFYRGEKEQGGSKFKPGRATVFNSASVLKISPTVYVDSEERTYTTKHGTQAVMQTKNIGHAAGPATTAEKRSAEAEPSTAGTTSSERDEAEPSLARAAGPVMPPLEDEPASPGAVQQRELAAAETSPQESADARPPEYSDLDRAQDQIADLQAALALANLGSASEEERQQAGDLISDLQAEVKSLQAQLRAVTSTRDFLLEENAQMKAQMAAQRREITRLKASEPA